MTFAIVVLIRIEASLADIGIKRAARAALNGKSSRETGPAF
jgi:hypothetical protein